MSHRSCQSRATAPHRVVLLVDQGSNPFEMGCACEIFGARRVAELGFEPYSLRLAAPGGRAVMRDVLFVDDGDVLTSAGSAAALDLGLHVVRRDYGAAVANAVSRRLVFAAFRDGGQRQFVDHAVPPSAAENDLADVMAWARDHLGQPLDVSVLAGHAHLSVTTLHRRFRDRIGTTPLAWLTGERVDLARRLIEGTDLPLDAIAHRSGLGTAANLRKQLRRQVGMPPSHYRRQFSTKNA